jgi:hypothetical protein
MPRCEQCRFFHAYPPASQPDAIVVSADGIRGGGECRLHPPVQIENETLARFPVVSNDCWCGCFAPTRE